MNAPPQGGWRRMPRRILRVLTFLLVAYALWLVVLVAFESKMLFPRALAGPRLEEAEIPAEVERVWLNGDDGVEVEGWFVPAQGAPGEATPAVLFFHGNAELIDHNLSLAREYRHRGVSTLLAEYRGYGRSGGRPSQKPLVADAVRFHDWLAAKPGMRGRIIIHGRSVGTGVAAQLAGLRPAAALILESPFSSVASFAAGFGAPPFVVRNSFRSDRILPALICPILILHSREDDVIPFAHAEKLKRLAPSATLAEFTGGHNAGLAQQPRYWQAIDALLATIRRRPADK
jgi:fermentation-respiration switch protein FrsA (DUF1100 family)